MATDIQALEAKLTDALARLEVIERASCLALHLKNERLVSRTRGMFEVIARLVAADPDARTAEFRKMNSIAVKTACELATHEDKLEIVRDLDVTSREAFLRWADRSAAIRVMVDLIPTNELIELVEVRNMSPVGVGWTQRDQNDKWVAGRELGAGEYVHQPRAEFEKELTIDELVHRIGKKQIVVSPVDEPTTRAWLCAAISNGVRYSLRPDYSIKALSRDDVFGSVELDAQTRRSVAKTRAADHKAKSEALEQNHAAIVKNAKLASNPKST